MRRVMLALSRAGVTTWRNNCGAARYEGGAVVRYGIANPGGSDLIGLRSIVVTPEMVGQRVAVFVAVEIKTPAGRLSPEQRRFLDFVREAGGVGFVARSEAEIPDLLR